MLQASDSSKLNNLITAKFSMSIYTAIHNNLINSRKHLKEEWKPVGSGLERHHIKPRHIGGLDEETNYTYLTHREHIIAHWLLWKLYGRSEDRIAYLTMNGKDIKVAYHSEETRRKMSEAKKGTYIPWNKGKKTGDLCSRKGFKFSEESKKKMSDARKGRAPWNKGKTGIYSKETLMKIGAATKKRSGR